jgi:cell division protein FtsB
MRPSLLLALSSTSALLIVGYATFSPAGLPRLQHLRAEVRKLDGEVQIARTDNQKLVDDVRVLRGDDPASPLVLEKLAREELGYVGKGEIVMTGRADPVAGAVAGAPPRAP